MCPHVPCFVQQNWPGLVFGFVSCFIIQVKLVPYDPHYLDRSVLWSKSGEIMKDFHYIRMVDNIYLNLDIRDKGHHDCYHSRVQDGTKAMLSYRCEGDNQYWRMVPWSKSLHSTLHKLLFVAIAFSWIWYFLQYKIMCITSQAPDLYCLYWNFDMSTIQLL